LRHARVASGVGKIARPGRAGTRRRLKVHGGNLGPLLCWSIVFADIGTSIYYVPGIVSASGSARSIGPARRVAARFVFCNPGSTTSRRRAERA
jgi:hypothetical protein